MRSTPSIILFIIHLLSCNTSPVEKNQQTENNKSIHLAMIKCGTYRQQDSLYKSDHYDLLVKEDQTFTFYDTRDESCWVWQTIEGNWQINKDTLTVLWVRKFRHRQENEIIKFLIKRDSLLSINPGKKNIIKNWGSFRLFSEKYLKESL